MYNYNRKSKAKLKTCDTRLQEIFNEVIKIMDITILEGTRDEATQNKYFDDGVSTLEYPKSRHNRLPSGAVDAAPYPIDWNDLYRFRLLVNIVKYISAQMGYKITCGADWEKFRDYPHFQIEEK